MKQSFLLFACISCLTITSCSQSVKSSQVPAAVKSAVEKKYPGINGKWEQENGNYEFNLKKDNKEISLVVTTAGVVIETETEIAIAELPATAISYMKSHYAGKSIKEAAKIIDKDGIITYEAGLKEKDVLFDGNGNYIKEVKN